MVSASTQSNKGMPLSFDTLWTTKLPAPVKGSPGLVETDAGPLVIIGTEAGDVVALDGTGAIRWKDSIDASVLGWPTVMDLPSGRAVLIGDSKGVLHAYTQDGSVLWRTPLGTQEKNDTWHSGISPWSGLAPLISGGDAAIVVTDRSGRLSALTADGDIVWQVHLSERTHFNLVGLPAVGDLDGDGVDEIVVTSFDGRAFCFGADGSMRWARNVYPAESGYHSPLIVDLGDGPCVLMMGENPAEVCYLDANGREIWKHESTCAVAFQMTATPYRVNGEERLFVGYTKTGQEILDTRGTVVASHSYFGGEGVFFGPTAADIDGDGSPELLMVRFHHPTLWVLDSNGNERATIDIGGETSGAPLIADLNADGVPEFVVIDNPSGTVRAFRVSDAQPGGEIYWPTSRGSFDGRRNYVSPSASGVFPAADRPAVSSTISIERVAPVEFPAKKQPLQFVAPGAEEGAWLWSQVNAPDDFRHIFVNRVDDPDHGWIEPLATGEVEISARLHGSDGALLGETSERFAFTTYAYEQALNDQLLDELSSFTGRAALPNKRIAALRAEHDVLSVQMDKASSEPNANRRELGVALAEYQAALRADIARRQFANEAASPYASAELAVWPTDHPWTPYDPAVDAPSGETPREIGIETEGQSHEASSVAVANLTDSTLSVRVWLDEWTGGDTVPCPDAVTLRRRVFVATARGGMTPDALPELDPSGVVTIPAGESLRIWLDWKAGDIPAGTYESKLRIRALSVQGEVIELPVTWRILPVALPEQSPLAFHVWAYERPEFFDRDAVWEDLIDHRVTVFDPPVAEVLYDADGNIVSEDWSKTDEYLSMVPEGAWLFWTGRDAIVKPVEGAPDIGSPAWERAFKEFVPRWIDGLAERGFPLDRHMNYFLDEPGIHGGGDVDEFVRIATLFKNADPRTPIFCNPAGGTSHEHIEQLAAVTDVFAPIWQWPNEYMHLHRILSLGKRVWTYECGDGAKDNVRMEYYWAPLWRGAQIGLTGAGIWSYAGRSVDFWQGPYSGPCDWELVYHGVGGSVVPSHRWQGVRIGIEDSIRLHLIKEAADRARESGDVRRADELDRIRADAMNRVIDSRLDEGVAAQVRSELRAVLTGIDEE